MDVYSNRGRGAGALETCDLRGDCPAPRDAIEPCQAGLHLGQDLLQLRLVHAGRVEVAELLRVGRALGRIPGGGGLEDLAKNLLVPFGEDRGGPPEAPVGRDGVGGQPAAAGELVEVVTGLHRLVERSGVEAGRHRADHGIGALWGGLAPRRRGRRCRRRSRGAPSDDERKQHANGAQHHGGWSPRKGGSDPSASLVAVDSEIREVLSPPATRCPATRCPLRGVWHLVSGTS